MLPKVAISKLGGLLELLSQLKTSIQMFWYFSRAAATYIGAAATYMLVLQPHILLMQPHILVLQPHILVLQHVPP